MEEKKEIQKKELNEEELDKVAGGVRPNVYYTCKDCGYSWSTRALDHTCPICKSRNVE